MKLKHLAPIILLPFLLAARPATAQEGSPVKIACYTLDEIEALTVERHMKTVLAGIDQTGDIYMVLHDPTVNMSYVFAAYDDKMCMSTILGPSVVFGSPVTSPSVTEKTK